MLEVHGLKVSYGGINAVKGIDLSIAEGELVCLIGANGAGKTSALKAIAAMIRRSGGVVRLAGEDTAGLASHQLVRRGLALVPEGRGIFGRLISARPMASICCSPPESVPPVWPRRSYRRGISA